MRLWQGLEVFDEDSPNRQLVPAPTRPLIEGGQQSGGQTSSGCSSDEGKQEGSKASSGDSSGGDSAGGAAASASPALRQGLEGAASVDELRMVSGGAIDTMDAPPVGKVGDSEGGTVSAASPAVEAGFGDRTQDKDTMGSQDPLILICGDAVSPYKCLSTGHLKRQGACASCKKALHPECGVKRSKGPKVCRPCAAKEKWCAGCSEKSEEPLTVCCGTCGSELHEGCADVVAPECRQCVQKFRVGRSPVRKKTECGDRAAGFVCQGRNVLFRVFGSCTDCQAPLHRTCGVRVGDGKVCKGCAGRQRLCGVCLKSTDEVLEDRCDSCKVYVHAGCGCQEDGSTKCAGCSSPPAEAGGRS